jgi:signal transduction histidine kinase
MITGFISDRTPLNTISLSLRLLGENLGHLRKILEPIPQLNPNPLDFIQESLELIEELEENSVIAVTTLNDLINYDKIETNTFSIEKNVVNVWTVVEKTLSPLTLQAKEKEISLTLTTQLCSPHEFPEEDDHNVNLNNLRVVGDSIKLGQVVRNLVSNALKFTPSHGQVKVSGNESDFPN